MSEVITYEVQQKVKVRKYPINAQKLANLLRGRKKFLKLSNKDLATKLNLPLTMVEHWFRLDNSFCVPLPEVWDNLKKLLKINTTEFDDAITVFEEKENIFEKSNRIYDENGIAPTIVCNDSIKVIKNEPSLTRLGNIYNEKWGTGLPYNVWDKEGLCPTLTTMQGGGREPMIIEEKQIVRMVGRNPDNPSDKNIRNRIRTKIRAKFRRYL